MAKKGKSKKTTRKKEDWVLMEGEVVDLRPTDVLMGRGNGIAAYEGNKKFRSIVWSLKDQYRKAHRIEKSAIAAKALEKIASLKPPGRFVERLKGDTYIVVNSARAMEKTCQALREKKLTCPKEYLDEMKSHGPRVIVATQSCRASRSPTRHGGVKAKKSSKSSKAVSPPKKAGKKKKKTPERACRKDYYITPSPPPETSRKPKTRKTAKRKSSSKKRLPTKTPRHLSTSQPVTKKRKIEPELETEAVITPKPASPTTTPALKDPPVAKQHFFEDNLVHSGSNTQETTDQAIEHSLQSQEHPPTEPERPLEPWKPKTMDHAVAPRQHNTIDHAVGSGVAKARVARYAHEDSNFGGKIQDVIDQAVQKQLQVKPLPPASLNREDTFSLLPPSLTALFSGIYSDTFEDAKLHPETNIPHEPYEAPHEPYEAPPRNLHRDASSDDFNEPIPLPPALTSLISSGVFMDKINAVAANDAKNPPLWGRRVAKRGSLEQDTDNIPPPPILTAFFSDVMLDHTNDNSYSEATSKEHHHAHAAKKPAAKSSLDPAPAGVDESLAFLTPANKKGASKEQKMPFAIMPAAKLTAAEPISSDLDEAIGLLPPELASFFGGIYAKTNGCASSKESARADLQKIHGDYKTMGEERDPTSPNTVLGETDWGTVPAPAASLKRAHSLLFDDEDIEAEEPFSTLDLWG